MSSTKPTGGPAFPTTEVNGCNIGDPGMDLRDWFAAHSPFTVADAVKVFEKNGEIPKAPDVVKMLAYMSFQYADAMLEARQK